MAGRVNARLEGRETRILTRGFPKRHPIHGGGRRTSAHRRLSAPICVVILLLTLTFALVPFVPRAAADSGTWTTDADFTAPYAIFVGTEVLGTGVPAHIDLMRDAHGWTNRDPSAAPGAREGPGMTFSTYDNVSVLFGGYNATDLQDTWEYDYAADAWTLVTTSPKPPGREWPGLSYDPVEKLVVLFGGVNGTNGFLNDTWEFNVVTKTWTERSPTVSPPPLA